MIPYFMWLRRQFFYPPACCCSLCSCLYFLSSLIFFLFASNEPHGSYVVMNFVRFNISAQQLFSSVFYHRLCVAAAHVLGRQLMCILWNVAVAASSKQMILDVCRHSTLHLFVVQLLVCIRDMLIHNLPIWSNFCSKPRNIAAQTTKHHNTIKWNEYESVIFQFIQ